MKNCGLSLGYVLFDHHHTKNLLVHVDKLVPYKNSYTLHHKTADEPLGRNNNAIVRSIVVNCTPMDKILRQMY